MSMESPEYAAHCECGAFGVSTDGTNWSQGALTQLARTHLRNCPNDETEMDLVERVTSDDGVKETVVQTVTLEVASQ